MPSGEYLQYGGQAIIEGVMMRSPRYFAVACRAPNHEIVLRSEPLAATWVGRQKWLKKPFLRGTLALLDAMALGIRALQFASQVQLAPEYQKPGVPAKDQEPISATEPRPMPESIQGIAIGGAMVIGLVFGIALFFVIPTMVSELFKHFGWRANQLNMLDGVLRIAIFIGYVSLISLAKDIRRVFQYHGAEHKAINALEADLPLNMQNAKAQTRLHPRCGTSFIIVVLILSIFVFGLLPRPPLLLRLPLHLAMLPIIAGIAYEAIRLAGRFRASWLTKAVFAPGLLSQYLTTREPNDEQIEVAVAALRAVMESEQAPKEAPVPVG